MKFLTFILLIVLGASCSKYNYGEMETPKLDFSGGFAEGLGTMIPRDPADPDSVPMFVTNRDPAVLRVPCTGEETFEVQNGFSFTWTQVTAPCVNGIAELTLPSFGPGEHDMKIRSRRGDAVSPPMEFKLVIDQTMPLNPPVPGAVTSNPVFSGNLTSYPLTGTCDEPGSTILIEITDVNGDVVSVSPAPICQDDGTWSTTVDISQLADGDLDLSVQIRDLGGNVSPPEVATLTKDTAPRTIFATVPAQSIAEGAGTFNVRVELSSSFAFPTSFTLAYTNNTTFDRARDDFDNGPFTIPTGVTFIDIPVTITDDNVYDANQLIEFDVLTSAHATVDPARRLHAVTITNDDALPTVRLAAATSTVSEAAASGTITVELVGTRSAYPITVPYTVADVNGGLAKLDNFVAGNVVIPANATSATITYNLLPENDLNDGDLSFQVSLGTPTDSLTNTLATAVPTSHVVTIDDNDVPPVVGFTAATASVSEAGTSYSFAYTVSRAFSQPITVDLALAGTADRNTDYRNALGAAIPAATFSVTIPAFATSGNYTISIVNDVNDENDETVSLTMTALSSPNGTPVLGPNPALTLTITDDEANPVITLSGGGNFIEGAGTVTLTATLSHPSELTITAPYTLDYQTSSSFDHDAFSGSLTFAPLETTKTITVNLTDDTMDEPDETFSVVLSGSPTNGTYPLPNLPQVVTVEDNDAAPTVQLSASAASAAEGATVTLTLTMSGPSGHAISVPVSRSGTAVNPGDYTLSGTSLTIPATAGNPATGTTTGTITVSLVDNAIFDVNKNVRFDLDPASNVVIHPTNNNATVTITENDSQPRPRFASATQDISEGAGTASFDIQLATNTTNLDVTVPYTVSNVSGGTTKLDGFSSGSVVIPAGASSVSVPFNLIAENDINDGDMVFRVTLGSATTSGGHTLTNVAPTQLDVTIRDNDTPPVISFATNSASASEASGQYTFTINMNRMYSQSITLNVTLAGSSTRNTDYFDSTGGNIPAASYSLTIPANTMSITHVISLFDDNIDENSETVSLTLNSASSALGTPTIGGTSVHTLTITDDENAPTLILTAASPVAEAAGTYNVVASLSHPSSFAVSSPFTVTQGTASAFDHNGASGTVSFATLETSKNIAITITNDTMDEPDETFTIALSGSCTNCAFATPNVTHTVTISDDDDPPTITLSASSLSVEEWTSGAITLTMTMSGPSGWPISVPMTLAGTATSGTDYTLSGSTFTIAATTGNPAAGITTATQSFTMIDDTALEPAETIEFTLGTASNVTLGSPVTRTINIGATDAPNFVAHSAPTDWGTSNVSRTRDYVFRNTGNETTGTISSFVLSSAHSGYSLGTNGCTSTVLRPRSSHTDECTVRVNFDHGVKGTYTANWAISEPRSNSLSGSISATMDFSWNYWYESFDPPSGGSYLGEYSPNGSYGGTCEVRGWSAYQPAWQGGSYWDCESLNVYHYGTYTCYVQNTYTNVYGYCPNPDNFNNWEWNNNCTEVRTEPGGSYEYYYWSYNTTRYSCGSTSGDSRYQTGSGYSNYKYWCSDPDVSPPAPYSNSCGGCHSSTYQYTANYSCQ